MKLSPRLAAVAAFAEGGRAVADIGTDHGYIPVHFALMGGFSRIAASDINRGPLESARENAGEAGVADKIEFCLADGLRGLDGGFDTIIIAGMGGETIAGILAASPFPLAGKKLVIQPQSKIDELAAFLYENDMAILRAEIVRDAGKLYAVFEIICGRAWSYAPTEAEKLAPRELRSCELYGEYREELQKKLRRRIDGLMSAENADETELERLRSILNDL